MFNGHFGVEVKQLFQPFGIIFEAAAYVDALQHFVIAIMRMAQVFGHFTFAIFDLVQIGDGGGKMCFPRQQNILRAACEIAFVFFSEWWKGERVPAKGV